MLEKKVPFCIDHFSIATTHRDRPIDLVTKLGFTTADCYTDRTVHFIFENSYFELCTYQLNTTITWLTQSVPATNLPKVHSYRLSVKGTDPNPMRNALIIDHLRPLRRRYHPQAVPLRPPDAGGAGRRFSGRSSGRRLHPAHPCPR